jgi:hypothetical protein
MAVVNAGLLGAGLEEDPNLFVGGADALAESNRVRMQPNINLTPSQMTPSGANLEEYRAAEAAANAAQRPPMSTPVTRDFDPDAYLKAMATGGSQMTRETGIMGALGYALKLQNPSFDASGYIKNYKARKHAQMKQQWTAMTTLNQQQVERQVVNRMMKANPENLDQFKQFWSGLGVPNLSMMNRTLDVWRKMNPPIDPDKEYLADGGLAPKGIQKRYVEYRQDAKRLKDAGYVWQKKLGAVMRGLEKGNGLGDLAAINAFQKMIDEGVVKGEDVRLIAGAVSTLNQLKLWKETRVSGDQLSETTRAQMADMARSLFEDGSKEIQERLLGQKDIVNAAHPGLDWNKIIAPTVFNRLTGDNVDGLRAKRLMIPTRLMKYFDGMSPKTAKKLQLTQIQITGNARLMRENAGKWVLLQGESEPLFLQVRRPIEEETNG